MYRAFIAHALVGVLLTCQFLCLHNSAARGEDCCAVESTAADFDVKDDCCPCGPRSDRNGPVAPQQGNGGTCLCHGAVLERQTTPPAVDLQVVSPATADDSFQHSGPTIADGGLALDPSTCDFATIFSGRTLRALIASFLI